jgi:uncharacterized protein
MKASIEEQKALLDLQFIDSAIFVAQNKMADAPEREQLVAVDKKIAHAESELAGAKAAQELVEVELKRSEVEVEAITDRRKKDEAVLAAGTVPAKEMEKIQHEIGSLNKRQAELEEVELEIMERAEKAAAEIIRQSSDLDGLLVIKEELAKRLASAMETLSAEIEIKSNERKDLLPKISPELIELYEAIRIKNAGIGAVRLVGDTCQGCQLTMTAAELQKVRALPVDELVRCEECRRILIRI